MATLASRVSQNWRDIYYTARDGLRLHARHYPARGSMRRPALCLAGLSRNAKDFHDLATALSGSATRAREVFALDYRGRGLSEHDSDWTHYSLFIELNDVLDFMTLKGLNDAAIIGTSRGGLIAMMMAAARPTALGAVVLNDIGPVIEREGLARIVAYVGRIPLPPDWKTAALLIKDLNQRQFPAVPQSEWEDVARQWFNEENGLPAPGYDPNLSRAISLPVGPLPELWPQFAGLARVPALAIRGEASDILSFKTFEEMRVRHPRLTAITVSGQGHAPLLRDRESITSIADFLADTDAPQQRLFGLLQAIG
jgi:pimeloyl-ACP methyl ester carboxylesterase